MAERPSKEELVEAVRRFLDEELVGELSGVKRFHALVASNALGIVARELSGGGESLAERHRGLLALLDRAGETPASPEALARVVDELERELVGRIRSGEAEHGSFRRALLAYLEGDVRARLAIDNPRYR